MKHPDAFLTIHGSAEGVYRDRGSKFLGFIMPCRTELELKSLIDQCRKTHRAASHICSAAIFSEGDARFSDDGEPSGTAGLPLLNQLKSHELSFVAILVVRYYGGTKLGKQGLIKAYKETAKQTIANAKIVVNYNTCTLKLKFAYEATGEVMKAIEGVENSKIIRQEFGQYCSIEVSIPQSAYEAIVTQFAGHSIIEVAGN